MVSDPYLPLHPLSTLFPAMEGAEFDAFVDDIAENGQCEPIVTLDGHVLDGRNRQAACERLGLVPDYVPYAGNDPLAFVLSRNLQRRHLTESQRAMVAAKLANMPRGRNQHTARSADLPIWKAAKRMAISERSAMTARSILRLGSDDLVSAVHRGSVSLHKAGKTLHLPKKQQMEALEPVGAADGYRLNFCRDVGALTWGDLAGLRNELAEDLRKVEALLADRVVDDASLAVRSVLPAATLARIMGGDDGSA